MGREGQEVYCRLADRMDSLYAAVVVVPVCQQVVEANHHLLPALVGLAQAEAEMALALPIQVLADRLRWQAGMLVGGRLVGEERCSDSACRSWAARSAKAAGEP